MNMFRKAVSRAIATSAVVVAVKPLAALPVSANSQQLTPFRCFTQNDNVHVVFALLPSFSPPTQQGPTRCKDDSGPRTASSPLYHGTSQGRSVDHVDTVASRVRAAKVLGLNYVPKLAEAVGTPAVQNSSSEIGTGHGVDFPA